MRRILLSLALGLLALSSPGSALADDTHQHMAMGHEGGAEAELGDLSITGGWARVMLPGQKAGGGYLTVANKGSAADRLVAAASPAAGKVEIHSMTMKGDVMEMRPLADGLEIPAGGTVELQPGGFHLMFLQVAEPFRKGGTVPVTLEFARAGKVDLSLPVEAGNGD